MALSAKDQEIADIAANLTDREVAIIRGADRHGVTVVRNKYYQVGGHGIIPVQYHPATLFALQRINLLTNDGVWRTTRTGRDVLKLMDKALSGASATHQVATADDLRETAAPDQPTQASNHAHRKWFVVFWMACTKDTGYDPALHPKEQGQAQFWSFDTSMAQAEARITKALDAIDVRVTKPADQDEVYYLPSTGLVHVIDDSADIQETSDKCIAIPRQGHSDVEKAISGSNVLAPNLTKRRFPERWKTRTAAFTTCMVAMIDIDTPVFSYPMAILVADERHGDAVFYDYMASLPDEFPVSVRIRDNVVRQAEVFDAALAHRLKHEGVIDLSTAYTDPASGDTNVSEMQNAIALRADVDLGQTFKTFPTGKFRHYRQGIHAKTVSIVDMP